MFKMLNIENGLNFEYFGAGKNGSKSKSDSEVFLISKILRDEKNICRFILFFGLAASTLSRNHLPVPYFLAQRIVPSIDLPN